MLNFLLRKKQHFIFNMGAGKIRANVERVKLLAPCATIGGNEKS